MPQFEYTVSRTRKLSGLSLSISPEKGVVVRAPFWLPDLAIRHFVEEKSDWIIAHLQRLNQNKAPVKKFNEGEKHLFLGEEFPLVFRYHQIPTRTQAEISGGEIIVNIFEGHADGKRVEESREALLRLYLEKGIGVLTEKVNFYCGEIGVDYSQIVIKKVSSIWGSCSPSNKLCFNRKLIMAPHEVIDYVVIHEVCHLVHRNHGSRFWGLVARYDPDYKKHRRWLYHNHAILDI